MLRVYRFHIHAHHTHTRTALASTIWCLQWLTDSCIVRSENQFERNSHAQNSPDSSIVDTSLNISSHPILHSVSVKKNGCFTSATRWYSHRQYYSRFAKIVGWPTAIEICIPHFYHCWHSVRRWPIRMTENDAFVDLTNRLPTQVNFMRDVHPLLRQRTHAFISKSSSSPVAVECRLCQAAGYVCIINIIFCEFLVRLEPRIPAIHCIHLPLADLIFFFSQSVGILLSTGKRQPNILQFKLFNEIISSCKIEINNRISSEKATNCRASEYEKQRTKERTDVGVLGLHFVFVWCVASW